MEERKKWVQIQKEFNIVVNLPQICSMCKGKITVMTNKGHGLCFHSLDGDHDNWSWGNKVPMHNRCHLAYHSLRGNTDRHVKGVNTKKLGYPYGNDEERIVYVINLTRERGLTATITRIMQQTGWRTAKVRPMLEKMVAEGKILEVPGKSRNRAFIHYVEVEGGEV